MQKKSLVVLLLSVSILVVIGFVMLMSTCLFGAHANAEDQYFEAKRQAIWLGLGVLVCIGAAMTDYRFWRKFLWPLFGLTCFLLVLCFVPGIGMEINGERRWIGAIGTQIQPSELAKIMLVVFLAYWFSRFPDCGHNFFRGFAAPLAIAGVLCALVLFEVDIGTTAVLGATTFVLLYVGGANWKYLIGLGASGVAVFVAMLHYAPNRMERIMAFIDPEKHRLDAGFQQWVSLMAIGSGGMTGRGIGEGRLKMLYMPFAHTDFIFPMIGEELGVIGTVAVVLAFICFTIAGFAIASDAPDRFGNFLGIGLCTFLALQAFLNIGVTTSMLPNTGLPLPFVSYGGSSMVVAMLAVGILINIYRQGRLPEEERLELGVKQRITPRL